MDSIKLAARCYNKGLLSKEAFEEVLKTRDRLIKEAISLRIGSFAGKSKKALKKGDDAGGFMSNLKRSLGMGNIEKAKGAGKDGADSMQWSSTIGNLVKLLGAGAALQGGAAGVQGIMRHRNDKKLKGDIQTSYKKMLQIHPQLQEFDRAAVSRNFGVLARYAPSLAADPAVAGSWVTTATKMHSHIDPSSIKQLSETQTAIDRAHQERGLVQPGQFQKGLGIAQAAMG